MELKTHTDEYLERKKGLQKKRDSLYREYREWYCSSSQWVTDFDAAGPGGAGAVGGDKKEGVIGELNCSCVLCFYFIAVKLIIKF